MKRESDITPRINIDLAGIEANARLLKARCQEKNIRITGVVKGAAGDLEVARAFVRGGIESIGDSRIKNILNLRKAGFEQELVLLRLPQLNEVEEVVEYTDVSLVSEITTLKALAETAARKGKRYGVIIMVDVGDLREGVLPENLTGFLSEAIKLSAIELKGLGTNVGCYGGVLPSRENTSILIKLREELKKQFQLELPIISGGNTATTILFETDSMPAGINNLRIGEGILQGSDITNQRLIKGLNHHNFTLTTRIIELKEKPSVPTGEIGFDAFGQRPEYEDKGNVKRAILAIGRQDVKVDGLTPLEEFEFLGASSDHLIVDISKIKRELRVGDLLEFNLDYGAMLQAMTSPYVYKRYV